MVRMDEQEILHKKSIIAKAFKRVMVDGLIVEKQSLADHMKKFFQKNKDKLKMPN